MFQSLGTTRHSTASSARDDTALEDANERIRELEARETLLRANETLLTEELSSLWFCAERLREELNLQQEHHETRCAEWGAAMVLLNLKMEMAKALLPEDKKKDVKELLEPISIPQTTKKPRLLDLTLKNFTIDIEINGRVKRSQRL